MKMQRVASDASKSSELIKKLITETERLRISCWNLLGYLDYIECEPTADELQSAKEVLDEAARGYSRAAKSFEESWAPVKGEVPLGMEKFIRAARHESINIRNIVAVQIVNLLDMMDRDPKPNNIRESVHQSKEALHELLAALDQFISLARSMNEVNLNESLRIV